MFIPVTSLAEWHLMVPTLYLAYDITGIPCQLIPTIYEFHSLYLALLPGRLSNSSQLNNDTGETKWTLSYHFSLGWLQHLLI